MAADPFDDPSNPLDPRSPVEQYRLILNIQLTVTDRTTLDAATLELFERDGELVLNREWLSTKLMRLIGHEAFNLDPAEVGVRVEAMSPWMLPVAADGSSAEVLFPAFPPRPSTPSEE